MTHFTESYISGLIRLVSIDHLPTEHGQVLDLPWYGVRGQWADQGPPLQRPDLRHPPVEGEARAGHGQVTNRGSHEYNLSTVPSKQNLWNIA